MAIYSNWHLLANLVHSTKKIHPVDLHYCFFYPHYFHQVTLYLPAFDRGENVVLDDLKCECMSLGGSGGGALSWYSLFERSKCAGDFGCLRRTGGGVVILFLLLLINLYRLIRTFIQTLWWYYWNYKQTLLSMYTYSYQSHLWQYKFLTVLWLWARLLASYLDLENS